MESLTRCDKRNVRTIAANTHDTLKNHLTNVPIQSPLSVMSSLCPICLYEQELSSSESEGSKSVYPPAWCMSVCSLLTYFVPVVQPKVESANRFLFREHELVRHFPIRPHVIILRQTSALREIFRSLHFGKIPLPSRLRIGLSTLLQVGPPGPVRKTETVPLELSEECGGNVPNNLWQLYS